jgi:peptidyl-prolyl cis-trans isomerase A (cyclophilin A)
VLVLKIYLFLKVCIRTAVSLVMLLSIANCTVIDNTAKKNESIKVMLSTDLGDVLIELYQQQAPVTVDNFLKYVDSGEYDGGNFYRVVRIDNDNGSPKIAVIQGDVQQSEVSRPEIVLETTAATGINHLDGTLSMARGEPNTATTSFFICIGAQPSLDFGGKRNSDGLGFAAFGRVIEGMDVVRAINNIRQVKGVEDAYMKGQMLSQPIMINKIAR